MNQPSDDLAFRGTWHWRILRADGSVRREGVFPNGITTAGLNSILDVYFRASAQLTAWYVGLIDSTSFSALAAGDTMSSHAGWIESTDYSESTRQQWSPPAASGGVLVNSSSVTFTANAVKTIKGVFLTSSNTKGGTTGTLWSTGLFDAGDVQIAPGEALQFTYSLTATGSA